MGWLMDFWYRLTGQAPPPVEEPPQREHMPELHALRNRQQVYGLRADHLQQQMQAERDAQERLYGWRRDS
jgi:hypothetical protein